MNSKLIERAIEYLADGLCVQRYSGDRPHCECCGNYTGGGHGKNCELNNLIKELEEVAKAENTNEGK